MPKWLMALIAAACLVILTGAGVWCYGAHQRHLIVERIVKRQIADGAYQSLCSKEYSSRDNENGLSDEDWNIAKDLRAKYDFELSCSLWKEFDTGISAYKNHREYRAGSQYSLLCNKYHDHSIFSKYSKDYPAINQDDYENAKRLHTEFPALRCWTGGKEFPEWDPPPKDKK